MVPSVGLADLDRVRASDDPGPGPVFQSVTSPRLAEGWDRLRAGDEANDSSLVVQEVSGLLEQASLMSRPLAQGGGRVAEWFIRTEDGTTVAFALDSSPSPAPVGDMVVVQGVRVGVLVAVGRDGVERRWSLYAGRYVGLVPGSTAMAWVAGSVLLMAIVWMMLVVRTRRGRRARPGLDRRLADVDHEEGLPEDPAEAMATLAALHDAGTVANHHDVEKPVVP